MTRTEKAFITLGMICSLSACSDQAESHNYIVGTEVFVCVKQNDPNITSGYDCRPEGQRNNEYRQAILQDRDGNRKFGMVPSWILVQCFSSTCLTVYDRTGYPQGTEFGTSPDGLYRVLSDWYLDHDAEGNPTAYKYGTGPLSGYPRYAARQSRPEDYGKKSCYDKMITEIHKEDPNVPISFDMMNEMLAECGLSPEK